MGFEKMNMTDLKRPGGRNMVFLYGFSGLDMEKLTGAVLTSKIDEWIYVDEKRKSMKIKDMIINLSDNQEVNFVKQRDQVILFNGVSQYELQQFITSVRAIVKDRPLIAMVTETSKKWKFEALINELKSERFELERRK